MGIPFIAHTDTHTTTKHPHTPNSSQNVTAIETAKKKICGRKSDKKKLKEAPWWTDKMKETMQKKNKAWRKWFKDRTDEKRKTWKRLDKISKKDRI